MLTLFLIVTSGCDTSLPAANSERSAIASGPAAKRRRLVRLDDEAIRRAGIETISVSGTRLEPEVRAYGRVLDPVPILDARSNLEAARSASEMADRQLRRVDALSQGSQNASLREVELARVASTRARADLAMVESRLIGQLGPVLMRATELSEIVRRLASRDAALIRIDVPGRADLPDPDRGARLSAYPRSDVELVSRFLGRTPSSDPLLPGTGYFFLAEKGPPAVGTPIVARLRSVRKPVYGVIVPAEAVLRHDANLFVFVALGEGAFERRNIRASILPGDRWFVGDGLDGGERVVVSGAGELLSEDLLSSGSAPSP